MPTNGKTGDERNILSRGRVAIYDIEATNLKGNFGFMLCGCIKFIDKDKIIVKRIDRSANYKKDRTDDSQVVREFADLLMSADCLVGHYGSKFDIPFVNTRLLYHGLRPMPKIPHVDTWRVARNNLALNSNRLDTLTQLLGTTKKTRIDGKIWIRATAGYADALKYIIQHCEADVRALEETYLKLRPLMFSHPYMGAIMGSTEQCPTCGSENTKKDGKRRTRSFVVQTHQCNDCGSEFSGARMSVNRVLKSLDK